MRTVQDQSVHAVEVTTGVSMASGCRGGTLGRLQRSIKVVSRLPRRCRLAAHRAHTSEYQSHLRPPTGSLDTSIDPPLATAQLRRCPARARSSPGHSVRDLAPLAARAVVAHLEHHVTGQDPGDSASDTSKSVPSGVCESTFSTSASTAEPRSSNDDRTATGPAGSCRLTRWPWSSASGVQTRCGQRPQRSVARGQDPLALGAAGGPDHRRQVRSRFETSSSSSLAAGESGSDSTSSRSPSAASQPVDRSATVSRSAARRSPMCSRLIQSGRHGGDLRRAVERARAV